MDNPVIADKSSILNWSLSIPFPKSVASPIILPDAVVGAIIFAGANWYSIPSGDTKEWVYAVPWTPTAVFSANSYDSLAPVYWNTASKVAPTVLYTAVFVIGACPTVIASPVPLPKPELVPPVVR